MFPSMPSPCPAPAEPRRIRVETEIAAPHRATDPDARLLELSRLEALARIVLGRIGAHLLRRGAHHDLGFIRLNDYTRERLGICAGELRAMARVALAVDRLPATTAAFRCGGLNWTRLRTITTVAEPGTEQMWLSLARRFTAESLRQLAKAAHDANTLDRLRAAYAGDTNCQPVDSMDHEGDDAGLERAAVQTLETACQRPPPFDVAWDPDPDPDTLDGEPSAFFRLRCPLGVLRLWRRVLELASRLCGEELAPWRAAEAVAAEGLAAAPLGGAALSRLERKYDAAGNACAATLRHLPNAKSTQSATLETDGASLARDPRYSPSEISLSSDISRLAANLDDAPPVELDRRARLVVAAMQRVDCEIGALLYLVLADKLYTRLGFPSFPLYVTNRLGLCLRKARTLVAMDRRSRCAAPRLASAYRNGEISCARALLLMPVISAANAEQWIQRAQEVTFRRLRAEVEWARERLDLSPATPISPPPADAPLEGVQIGDAGRPGTDSIGAQVAANEAVADVVLSTAIQFRAPSSVVAIFEAAIDAFTVGPEPRWRAIARLLEHVAAEWESQPRHRDPIFERDGWRCTVPACTSRRNLHDHHVIFRSRGGDNRLLNRTAVCLGHHQRDIHTGVLRAERKPGGDIEWWLGVGEGADGRAFLRLLGDRYLRPQSLLSSSSEAYAVTAEAQRRARDPWPSPASYYA